MTELIKSPREVCLSRSVLLSLELGVESTSLLGERRGNRKLVTASPTYLSMATNNDIVLTQSRTLKSCYLKLLHNLVLRLSRLSTKYTKRPM